VQLLHRGFSSPHFTFLALQFQQPLRLLRLISLPATGARGILGVFVWAEASYGSFNKSYIEIMFFFFAREEKRGKLVRARMGVCVERTKNPCFFSGNRGRLIEKKKRA